MDVHPNLDVHLVGLHNISAIFDTPPRNHVLFASLQDDASPIIGFHGYLVMQSITQRFKVYFRLNLS